jgi:hypothetical protein
MADFSGTRFRTPSRKIGDDDDSLGLDDAILHSDFGNNYNNVIDDLETVHGYAEKGKLVELDRKIPGPAGDLSHLNAEDFIEGAENEQNNTTMRLRERNIRRAERKRKYDHSQDESPLKQDHKLNQQDLEQEMAAWREMITFVCSRSSSGKNNLETFNFHYITERRGYMTPVPFLAIVIRHVINYDFNSAAMTLIGEYDYTVEWGSSRNVLNVDVKPSNSTMKAIVSKSAIDKWKAITTSGSVVLLKKVPIYKPSPDNHYLIITAGNVINLWATVQKLQQAEGRKRKRARLSQDSQTSISSADSSPSFSTNAPSVQSEGILDFDIYKKSTPKPTPSPPLHSSPSLSPPTAQSRAQNSRTISPPTKRPPLARPVVPEKPKLLKPQQNIVQLPKLPPHIPNKPKQIVEQPKPASVVKQTPPPQLVQKQPAKPTAPPRPLKGQRVEEKIIEESFAEPLPESFDEIEPIVIESNTESQRSELDFSFNDSFDMEERGNDLDELNLENTISDDDGFL